MRLAIIGSIVVLLSLAGIVIRNDGIIFLPVVSSQPAVDTSNSLLIGYVKSCLPSSQSTRISLQSFNPDYGYIVLSKTSDGNPIFKSRLDELILSIEGPLAGEWWVWLTDKDDIRISESVVVYTDEQFGLGKCQQAVVVFDAGPASRQPVLLPLAWDSALTRMGVHTTLPQISSGETFWHLVEAEWENEQEANGEGRIYVEVLDVNGVRDVGRSVTVFWDSGSSTQQTEDHPNSEYSFHFPMEKSSNAYNVRIEGYPSETLVGAGLGTPEMPFHTIRTNTRLKFQLTTRP